jgi:hypothetical protein
VAYRYFGLAAVLPCAIVLIGCTASDPYRVQYFDIADEARIFNTSKLAGGTKIIVKRSPDFSGASTNHVFSVDETSVVDLHRGESYQFFVTPGQHVVGIKCLMLGATYNDNIMVNALEGAVYVFYTLPEVGRTPCRLMPLPNQ